MSDEESVHRYLEEGLVALLPVYRAGVEGTKVFTLVQTYELYHSLAWALELLARYCCLDLASLRRRSGRLLGVRHHIPLPFAAGLVLLPVKVRRGDTLGERTAGYVNFPQVTGVEGAASTEREANPGGETPGPPAREGGDGSNCRSRISCQGTVVIHCLNTVSTVNVKLRQGEKLREELAGRHRLLSEQGAVFKGFNGAALQELLPSCDCLLRNIMLTLLNIASPPEQAPDRRDGSCGLTGPPGRKE